MLASTPGIDVRLSKDFPGRSYVSAADIAGLPHYPDDTLDECSRARGRQNEPATAIDPRDSRVMIGGPSLLPYVQRLRTVSNPNARA